MPSASNREENGRGELPVGNLASLLDYAAKNRIEIDWIPMRRAQSLSLPLPDGTFGVAVDPRRLAGRADEYCKVAHEVGHCMTGSFYNRYSDFDLREKQEHRADRWAIERVVPVEALDEAVAMGNTEIWMLAEHFGVTEDFMRKAVCFHTHGHLAVEEYLLY